MAPAPPPVKPTRPRSLGLWVALVANAFGLCAGAVFLFAKPGARFRGMEPEAVVFMALTMFAVCLGLLSGVVSVCELLCLESRPRARLTGLLLSLTPGPVAVALAGFLEWQLGLIFD